MKRLAIMYFFDEKADEMMDGKIFGMLAFGYLHGVGPHGMDWESVGNFYYHYN